MINTQKVNIYNERQSQPTFTYVLPANWCGALLTPELADEKLAALAAAWLEYHGLRKPFAASSGFMGRPEVDDGTGIDVQPCRTYSFSR